MSYNNLIYDSCNIVADDINSLLTDYIIETEMDTLLPDASPKQQCPKLISNECRQRLNKLRSDWTSSKTQSLEYWDKLHVVKDVIKSTNGPLAKFGDKVLIYYSIHRTDGLTLDYSRKAEWFTIGDAKIIKGLNIALLDIRRGEIVKIYIPSHLAYGWTGLSYKIPPHTDIVIRLRLISIKKKRE